MGYTHLTSGLPVRTKPLCGGRYRVYKTQASEKALNCGLEERTDRR